MFDVLFNRALKSGVEKGEFSQPKGKSFALLAFKAHCLSRLSRFTL
jgi:hypothetical protein